VGGHRASGWRATCRFDSTAATDGADLFGVQIDVVGPSRIDPGEVVLCVLRLWATEVLPGPIEAGTHLTIFEGAKQVAIGTVVSFAEVGND
jgi:hypothetical protein